MVDVAKEEEEWKSVLDLLLGQQRRKGGNLKCKDRVKVTEYDLNLFAHSFLVLLNSNMKSSCTGGI